MQTQTLACPKCGYDNAFNLLQTDKGHADCSCEYCEIVFDLDTTADVYRLAIAFGRRIRSELSSAELRECNDKNLAEIIPGICHSHDFTDATYFMFEAFCAEGFGEDVHDFERASSLVESAWSLAKRNGFSLDVE
jgi:hypothetical protein